MEPEIATPPPQTASELRPDCGVSKAACSAHSSCVLALRVCSCLQNTTHIPYRAGALSVDLEPVDMPDRCGGSTNIFGDRLLGTRRSSCACLAAVQGAEPCVCIAVAAGNHAETSWMSRHISVPFIVCEWLYAACGCCWLACWLRQASQTTMMTQKQHTAFRTWGMRWGRLLSESQASPWC